MTLGLLEAAVDALDTYFQTNMAAKVTALNTEYGDSLLVAPVNYYQGQFPRALPEYPSMVFAGEAWNPEEQRGVNIHVANIITIVVFVGDNDEEQRWRKLCRYARLIVELLNDGESSYGYEHFLEEEIKLSEPFSGAEDWIQAVGVPVSLHKLEAY